MPLLSLTGEEVCALEDALLRMTTDTSMLRAPAQHQRLGRVVLEKLYRTMTEADRPKGQA